MRPNEGYLPELGRRHLFSASCWHMFCAQFLLIRRRWEFFDVRGPYARKLHRLWRRLPH